MQTKYKVLIGLGVVAIGTTAYFLLKKDEVVSDEAKPKESIPEKEVEPVKVSEKPKFATGKNTNELSQSKVSTPLVQIDAPVSAGDGRGTAVDPSNTGRGIAPSNEGRGFDGSGFSGVELSNARR